MEKNILIGITKAGNSYNAHAPAFPGCLATGKTADEARKNIVEALELHILGMMEDGEHIPEGDEFYSFVTVPLPGLDKKVIDGKYLREYRKHRNLTQADMAQKLEVTKESISEWERGKRELPGSIKFVLAEASL
jgi:Uncharacterized conserved protein